MTKEQSHLMEKIIVFSTNSAGMIGSLIEKKKDLNTDFSQNLLEIDHRPKCKSTTIKLLKGSMGKHTFPWSL